MKDRVSRPHWSYSSVSQFLRCPLQYYFERVLGLPRRSVSEAQVLGSSVHTALAVYHRKLQGGEAILALQVQDAFLTAWDDQIKEFNLVIGEKRGHDDSLALGISLIDLYLHEDPPEVIVAVEQPLLAPVVNSAGKFLEKPILVVPDLITRMDDGTLKVHEIKTSGRSFSDSELATSLQPTCYASAVHEMTGEEPSLEFVVLVKTKVPKLQRVETIRNTNDFGRLGDIIEAVGLAIDAGSFFPVESPQNCSGCPFFRECREWTGPGSSSSEEHEISVSEEATRC
jgi:putative RecB family exonuclease